MEQIITYPVLVGKMTCLTAETLHRHLKGADFTLESVSIGLADVESLALGDAGERVHDSSCSSRSSSHLCLSMTLCQYSPVELCTWLTKACQTWAYERCQWLYSIKGPWVSIET